MILCQNKFDHSFVMTTVNSYCIKERRIDIRCTLRLWMHKRSLKKCLKILRAQMFLKGDSKRCTHIYSTDIIKNICLLIIWLFLVYRIYHFEFLLLLIYRNIITLYLCENKKYPNSRCISKHPIFKDCKTQIMKTFLN